MMDKIGGMYMKNIRQKINDIALKTTANKYKGINDVLVDTLYYRLMIMRLGEEENNAWWESSILSEVGRRNLQKFFPNTFHRQRYHIARKILIDKETREIPERRYTSLFNYGYTFETEIFKPFINEISETEEWAEVLDMIEKVKGYKFNSYWARDFFEIPRLPSVSAEKGKVLEIGAIQETFYSMPNRFDEFIRTLLAVYDKCTTGNVITPYYKRGMAI